MGKGQPKNENGLDPIIAAGRHRSMTSRPGGTYGPLTLAAGWRLQPEEGSAVGSSGSVELRGELRKEGNGMEDE